MEHPALLIIDMQNDFVREGAMLRVAQAENVIPKIRDVLAFFRMKNSRSFMSCGSTAAMGQMSRLPEKIFLTGTRLPLPVQPGARRSTKSGRCRAST